MRPTEWGRAEGFAYIWVLLLVAFMGLGLTIGVQIYTTAVQRDKEKELLAIGRQFRFAIGRYYEATQMVGAAGVKRDYPASLEDLLKDNRSPSIRRHLRKIFVDPMTGKAEWGLIQVGGRIVGVHSLSDREPIKKGHFEADDSSFYGKEKYSEWEFTYPSDLLMRINSQGALAPNALVSPGMVVPLPLAQPGPDNLPVNPK